MFTISGWAATLVLVATFQYGAAYNRQATWQKCRDSPTWKTEFNEFTAVRNYPVDYDPEFLYLWHCSLTEADLDPKDFAGLPAVATLFLGNNNLQHFNMSVFKSGLPSLKQISLDSNKLTEAPEFNDHVLSPHLDSIDLSSNQISEIDPQSFSACVKVKKLRLHNNLISRISSWSSLRSHSRVLNTVEEIYLGNNKITQVPCIPNYSCLRILYLNNNELTDIPTACGGENSVEELILSGNSITNINNSNALFNFPQLSKLKLDENNIIYIHPQLFTTSLRLKSLDLSRNQITQLPGTMFSNNFKLEILDISENNLTEAPVLYEHVTPTHSPRLESLYLSQNQISEIKNTSFTNCVNLKVIKLDNNKITYLHPELFSTLTQLRQLNLSNNHISQLPNTIFTNNKELQQLWLQSNMISHLPNSMFINNIQLKQLWLQGNMIGQLPADFLFVHRDAKIPFALLRLLNNPWGCECLFEVLAFESESFWPVYFYNHPKPYNESLPACVAGALCPVSKSSRNGPQVRWRGSVV